MLLSENINLKPFNSFGISVMARYFAGFNNTNQLCELLTHPKLQDVKQCILGGGSNLLFTKDFDGVVLKNEIHFFQVMEETETEVVLKVGAGVNWHKFVMYCMERNWGGVENLSLIPGCVGASPMQNIGAYGVEVKDCIEGVETLQIHTREIVHFKNADCKFGYRDSIFKNQYKGQFIINAVCYRLSKFPKFNTSYGAIEAELEKMQITTLSIKAISDAVIHIRKSKLPDPSIIGNAGSFFKNPYIIKQQFELLQQKFPGIIGYPTASGHEVKLAAGWLIEQCGFKGYRKGDAGCHDKQALVLVNYGNANGNEIYALSTNIIDTVKDKFDVILEREVNIL